MRREQPPVMTVDEVAEYLRIPRASVYRLAQQGRIPCQKVGRHWRFRTESIDRWLDESPSNVDGKVSDVGQRNPASR